MKARTDSLTNPVHWKQ